MRSPPPGEALSFHAGSDLRTAQADTAGVIIKATFPGLLGMPAPEGSEGKKKQNLLLIVKLDTCIKDSQGLCIS